MGLDLFAAVGSTALRRLFLDRDLDPNRRRCQDRRVPPIPLVESRVDGANVCVTLCPERPITYMDPDELPRIAHDASILEAFYREHVEAIQRFVARRVGDPYLAADLTADVFLAAVDSAATYRRDRGAPTAWLFGIARIVVASESRRSARERRAVRQIEGRRLLESDDIVRIQDRIDAAAQVRSLYAALVRLPDGQRAVFELVALDELSVTDVAAALGIRPATARVRLHRARTTLRSQLLGEDATAPARPLEVSP